MLQNQQNMMILCIFRTLKLKETLEHDLDSKILCNQWLTMMILKSYEKNRITSGNHSKL